MNDSNDARYSHIKKLSLPHCAMALVLIAIILTQPSYASSTPIFSSNHSLPTIEAGNGAALSKCPTPVPSNKHSAPAPESTEVKEERIEEEFRFGSSTYNLPDVTYVSRFSLALKHNINLCTSSTSQLSAHLQLLQSIIIIC